MLDPAANVPFYRREISLRRGLAPAPQASTKPRKRQKKVVGLTIGASQLAAAQIVNNGNSQLVKLARQPLERGIVVGGELRDPEALAAALKTFFRKQKLPKTGVRLGIANNRIGVRIFEIEGIDDPKQLHNAIWFRAQEALPVAMDQAVLDYHVLDRIVTADGVVTWRVVLVVAYREAIERYVGACRDAGVKLSGVDLEAFALLRSLGTTPDAEAGAQESASVVVAVGHDRTAVVVAHGDVCHFTRVLDWGGLALDLAVARVLDISAAAAEPVRRQLDLDSTELPEGLSEDQHLAAKDAIERQIEAFTRDLVSALRFYQDQPDSRALGEVVLTGGTSHVSGLARRLERLLGVPVRVGDPLTRVKYRRRLKIDPEIGSLAGAIGLGIEI